MRHSEIFVGTITGVGAVAVPDELINWALKIALGVVVGVLTSLTMRLVDRILRRG